MTEPRPRGRRGFTIVELMVVIGLFFLVAGYALSSLWYNKKAAAGVSRIEDLHEARRLLTYLTRDLEGAVAVERPGWASKSASLEYLDHEYTRVRYYLQDESGTRFETIEAMRSRPPESLVQLVRERETAPGEVETKRIDKGVNLHWAGFYRLGRSLVGVRIGLRPEEDAVVARRREGELFSTVVSLAKQMQ